MEWLACTEGPPTDFLDDLKTTPLPYIPPRWSARPLPRWGCEARSPDQVRRPHLRPRLPANRRESCRQRLRDASRTRLRKVGRRKQNRWPIPVINGEIVRRHLLQSSGW